ncbi:toll/interleukin-1 receptor domain-containing protein [Kocuria flava]|uniref:toll/interleukin-1 receptor domain-containing protein n=1 Tax=Kocuria flava TaxID=446860 RepID=UPI000C7BDDB8|nr:toll/interleukin-1 receptor domain-containing protein [Kocuria flava]
MANLNGFWSYAHKDDDAEEGRITELARKLVREFELLTGDDISLFIDRDNLEWGNVWREAINGQLSTVAFFVPVLTPMYFQSAECKRELETLLDRAEGSMQSGIVLPILYADFRGTIVEDSESELIERCKALQWVDWTTLRLEEPSSAVYRAAVSKMAQRLVAANKELEEALNDAALTGGDVVVEDDDGEPGTLERMAEMEEALPEMGGTLREIGHKAEQIGQIMKATVENNKVKLQKSFAGKLAVARMLAVELEKPSTDFLDLTAKYSNELRAVDGGMQALIDQSADQITNEENQAAVADLFDSVIDFARKARNNLDQTEAIQEPFQAMSKLSRELRVPLRRVEQSVRQIAGGVEITDSWVKTLDERGFLEQLAIERPEWLEATNPAR